MPTARRPAGQARHAARAAADVRGWHPARHRGAARAPPSPAVRRGRRHRARRAALPARILEERLASGAVHSIRRHQRRADRRARGGGDRAGARLDCRGWSRGCRTSSSSSSTSRCAPAKGGHASAATSLYNRALSRPIPERPRRPRDLPPCGQQRLYPRARDGRLRDRGPRPSPTASSPTPPRTRTSSTPRRAAYAAIGAYEKALERCAFAVAHQYEHLDRLEADTDLGELLERPEFHALFRGRAGEGN